MDALTQSAARLKTWCVSRALPYWAEHAQRSDKSWVEHLKLDGTPDLAAERRWRVLARQVYVYAKASAMGWYDGREVAISTYKKMQAIGYVHRVNPEEVITNPMRDLYDHAFYILAKTVFGLFEAHFYDAGTVSEFFDSDWTLTAGEKGQTAEPGHAVEWIWLLGQYHKATGADVTAYQDALYAKAQMSRGWFLNDEEDKSGNIRRETKRLWVQTEVIKAHLAMAENGVAGARDMAAAVIDALFPVYLTPEGLWNDQINSCGANIAATIPVSTFYHILCMASESERIALRL